MDTLKMKHKGTVQMIAHRGVSGLEQENTAAAFVAAGNRSYFGIETDVHVTADGKIIVIHDDNTKRVAGCEHVVEETDFETLRGIKLLDKDSEETRSDLVLPTLEEYISICKRYEKVAVLELKNEMKTEAILQIMRTIEAMDYLASTIIISFSLNNLIAVRQAYPRQQAQYLVAAIQDMGELIATLKKYRLDIDARYSCMTEEAAREFQENGIRINAWTVNDLEEAERLKKIGVDYITTNIIE